MDPAECPVPKIGEALQPYIKSREQTRNLRQLQDSHLSKQINPEGPGLSSLTLTQHSVSGNHSPPSSLSGVRKAYWKALQAHTAAQAKYDALRAELEQLKRPKDLSSESFGARTNDAGSEDYVALLRQKEKHRKLKVIDQALSRMLSNNNLSSTGNLDDLVKAKVGELPIPPSAQPAMGQDPGVETKVTELKKAVVSAKRRVDRRRAEAEEQAQRTDEHEVSSEAEVAGLQRALQELTAWMEDRLTVIADAEEEQKSASEGAADISNGETADIDVDALYNSYLEARQKLVRDTNHFAEARMSPSGDALEPLFETSNLRAANSAQASAKASAAAILPFLPALLAAKAQEQSLVQQNSVFRRQLATAEDDTVRLIQRLAGESHLVQPGASRGAHWAEAAREAEKATKESVSERLKAGEAFMKSAREAHEAIQTLPATLQRLSTAE